MEFRIQQSAAEEVYRHPDWKLNLVDIERFINDGLGQTSFGESVNSFIYGFELFDFHDKFADFFFKLKGYASYRPKNKTLVVNDQIDFVVVRSLSEGEQLKVLSDSIANTIRRVGEMRRKPKSFDYLKLASEIDRVLRTYGTAKNRHDTSCKA